MTTAILVARMGSHRLPGKPMRLIAGKPMLERLVERVSRAHSISQVVLATTSQREDDALADWAGRLGIGCSRGSVEDVLGRILQASEICKADPIVEILGDNPLVDPALVDAVFERYQVGDCDYVASLTSEYPHAPQGSRCFPRGIRVQVFSHAVLARSEQFSVEPRHREHSTSFIYEHPGLFRLGYVEARGRWEGVCRPDLNWAVNTDEDFQRVQGIFQRLLPRGIDFGLQEILEAWEEPCGSFC